MNIFMKIVIGLATLSVVAVALIFLIFYKPDLSRQQLTDYISKSSKFIDLPNGANMHYRDEGNQNGPVLVMIHGGFGSLQNWEGWVQNLKKDYRLISMDLLGHGLTGAYPKQIYTRISERDAVHQLLQKLGVKQYVVARNSWGGGIALEMALAYPHEIEGLILVDSEGIPNGEDGYDASSLTDEKLAKPGDPRFTQLSWLEKLGSQFIGPAVIRSVMEQMTFNKDLLTDEYIHYFSKINRHKGNRYSQILMFRQGLYLVQKNDPQDLLPRLKELKMPTLTMHGKQDALVPLRVAKTFHKHIRNSDLVVIDGAGHMPMMEEPEVTAEAVRAFLRTKIGLTAN